MNLKDMQLWICGKDGSSRTSLQQIVNAVQGGMKLEEVQIVTSVEEAVAFDKKREMLESIVGLLESASMNRLMELRDCLRGVTKWPWEQLWLWRFYTRDQTASELYSVRGVNSEASFVNMISEYFKGLSTDEIDSMRAEGRFELLGQVAERRYKLDV